MARVKPKQIEGGSGGGGGVTGQGEVDFAAHPGSNDASLVITGQAGILAGSLVEAWIIAKPTAEHSADEHVADPPRLIAGAIVPGTGFTIFAAPRELSRIARSMDRGRENTQKPSRLYGRYAVGWRWQ